MVDKIINFSHKDHLHADLGIDFIIVGYSSEVMEIVNSINMDLLS
jgi:hypothetical protein